MGRRGPIIFGMLLSLSFFSGLLTLLLLSQVTSPIPPASQLPRLAPPNVEGPAVIGSPRGDDPLVVPFPVLNGTGGLVSVPTAADAGVGAQVAPGLVTGLRPPADGQDPAPGPAPVQPPLVTIPREEPEDEEENDRHERTKGKGHEKGHGKGHDHDVADAGGEDYEPPKGRAVSGKSDRPEGGGKAKGPKKK